MGKSIIEKIISDHTTENVAPGNIVWMEIDVRSARDFGGANVVKNLQKFYPNESQVADPDKTFFTFDCVVPAKTIGYAENQFGLSAESLDSKPNHQFRGRYA